MKSKITKTIRAISIGALLIGTTVSGAFALDVKDYPAPFIKDGKFTGSLVIGDKAAAEDVIGMSDILADLQYAAAGRKSSSHIEIVGGPDIWRVGTSTKELELSENLKAGNNRESLANITSNSYISESELGILAKGTANTNKGRTDYYQRLYFENASTEYVVHVENDNDITSDFLFFKSGDRIARYELEFTTALESDVEDSDGSTSSAGTFLTDFEQSSLKMLGKDYAIVQARRLNSEGNSVKLILMGGSIRDTLSEKTTKTYTVKGKDYEVTLSYVDSTSAQLVVNGQITRKLNKGDTDKLSDGTTVGLSEILYQNFGGGIHSATFFIGAQKVELRDSNIADTLGSNSLKVDDKTISDVDVIIEGTDDNSTVKLNRLNVIMKASDDFYVPAGGNLSSNTNLREPQTLFTNNWDIQYGGLTTEQSDKIKIVAGGSDEYNLQFVDWNGDKVEIPLAFVNSSNKIKLGNRDDSLVINESNTITKNDYFVVTDYSNSVGERPTYALRYKGADKETSDNKVIRFENLGNGEEIEVPYSTSSSPIATLKIGGGSYGIKNNSSTPLSKDFDIKVDLNQDGTFENSLIAATDKYGGQIDVIDGTPETINVSISTPNSDHFDSVVPSTLSFSIRGANGDVDMSDNGNVRLLVPQGQDNVAYGYTSYGTFVKFETPSSGEPTLEIDYPKHQLEAKVYVKSKESSITPVTPGEFVPQKIDVGAAKLASEVKDSKNQNLILVGGPCANPLVTDATGLTCDAWPLKPGEAFVRYFDNHNGNVAMLVAGTTKEDTRNAAKAFVSGKMKEATDVKIYTSELVQ